MYDVHRDRDTVNPDKHHFAMVHSSEEGPDTHPYWHAQALGVYHAFVLTTYPEACDQSVQRMEFQWVRQLGIEAKCHSGSQHGRLPMVGFVEDSDELAFGFFDLPLVIHSCHLIPRFTSG